MPYPALHCWGWCRDPCTQFPPGLLCHLLFVFANLPLLSSLSISQDTASWSLEVNCLCPLVCLLFLPVTSCSPAVSSQLLCAQPNISLTFHVPNPSWGFLLYISTWVVSKSRPHHFSTQGKRFWSYIKDYHYYYFTYQHQGGTFHTPFPHLSIEPVCQAQMLYSSSDVCSVISQGSMIFKGASLQRQHFLSMECEGLVTGFLLCPHVPLLKINNL